MAQQKLNGGKWASNGLRGGVILRDGGCVYCNATAETAQLTLDHIIARNTAGTSDNRPQNLVCACLTCNSKRQDKPVIAFLKSEGYNSRKIVAVMEKIEMVQNSTVADFAPFRGRAKEMIAEHGTVTVITGGKRR